MDTTQIKRGGDLMIFDASRKSIAFATSHTLTLTADATEISCKDTGVWKSSLINKLGWEISTDNLFCMTEFEKLFTAWSERTPMVIYFGSKTEDSLQDLNSPTESWTGKTGELYAGKAIITNISVNAADGDNASYSVTLQGIGKFEKTDSFVDGKE